VIAKHLVAVMILIGSAGCVQDPDIAHYTVEQYRANDRLRTEVFSKCIDDPGTLGETADCINAREAERLESHGSLRGSPPVGLDAKRNPAYPRSNAEPEVSVEAVTQPPQGEAK
jgi:hypothetical protein